MGPLLQECIGLVKCDTSSVGDGGGTESMPSMELLLCGVTNGNALLPVHFPPCWALPRRQSMLDQAQFSLGIFRRWKQSQHEVSSHRRGAGNASSIIGAQERRCMRSVHFQEPLEGELRAGAGGGMMTFQ